VTSNNAFERAVMPQRTRAASALGYCALAARCLRHCAAAQRERWATFVLSRLISFVTGRGRSVVEHEAIWAPARALGPDGLTHFQAECEKRLLAAAVARSITIEGRQVAGRGERFITGRIPRLGGAFWIYADGADIKCPDKRLRLEDWDVRDPEELYSLVVDFITKAPVQDVA
jgi:hypothetical protein